MPVIPAKAGIQEFKLVIKQQFYNGCSPLKLESSFVFCRRKPTVYLDNGYMPLNDYIRNRPDSIFRRRC